MRRWHPVEDETIRAGYAAGQSVSEIAAALGPYVTRNMVIGRARRLGLSKSHPVAARSIVWTDEKRALLFASYQNGVGTTDLARLLGVSVRAVYTQAYLAGLTNRASHDVAGRPGGSLALR